MKTRTLLIASVLTTRALFAHEGHPHAPGTAGQTSVTGAIEITAEAQRNLGVTAAEAEMRTIEKVLTAFGHVEPLPMLTAAVTSRIPGRIVKLNVTEGEQVKKGAPLVEIESLQVGDPPPRTTATAPIDGIVLERHVVLGSSVEPRGHLIDVADLSVIHADAKLFEGQIAHVKAGQKVRVQVESFPGETFEGVVERLGGSLDPETRTLEAHCEVKNPDYRLRPNMRATIHFVISEADQVIAVPHSAVLGEAGQPFVFVQTDEAGLKYERRTVIEGVRDDRFVEIVEGVLPGDKVVVSGNYQLQYVATTPVVKAGDAPHADAPKSEVARHEHDAKRGHAHTVSVGPWSFQRASLLLGVGLGVSLLLNLVLLARRSPRTA